MYSLEILTREGCTDEIKTEKGQPATDKGTDNDTQGFGHPFMHLDETLLLTEGVFGPTVDPERGPHDFLEEVVPHGHHESL